MNGILVLGGYSALAWHLCRRWVTPETVFLLAGRDQGRLARVARDLEARGAPIACTVTADLTDERAPSRVGRAMASGRDDPTLPSAPLPVTQAVVAYGILRHPDPARMDLANAVSAGRWVEWLIERLPEGGHIMVFGSVAGDRVRESNRAYGQAKADLEGTVESLRTRAEQRRISITLIKPGPTRTVMTRDLQPGLLWSEPSAVARHLARVLPARPAVVYAPPWWRWIMGFLKVLPGPIFRRLPI